MKEINVSDELGSCVIESGREIPQKNEFAIKALAGLQLLLLEADGPGVKMDETLVILKKAIDEIDELHSGENSKDIVIRDDMGFYDG